MKTEKDLRTLLSRVRRIEITAQRLVNEQLSGRYHSVFKGRGMSFDEVRPYTPGDEVRMIDWNVTARTGEPYVKRFVEERELTIMILADASLSMDFGLSSFPFMERQGSVAVADTKRELAAQIAAAIALSAQMNNDRVGLITFGDEVTRFIPPRKGRRHALHVIREVLTMEATGSSTDLGGALDYLGRVLKKRTAVFILSDFEVPGFEPQLRVAARRHDVHGMVVRDHFEDNLFEGGIVTIRDQETGALVPVSTDCSFLERYRGEVARHLDDVEMVFRRQRLPFSRFSTAEPWDRTLSAHFARLKGKAL
ncbi:MAG TPA: DUF58 domain-containing protein [Myxococcota bacterium]|nr:DUF58 domain-containing protein [Myxococcota bacterium]HOD06461.1 DUF58 domain-containing protein [Myxococcota bacterium]